MKMSTRGQRNLCDVLILSSSFRMNTLQHYTPSQPAKNHPSANQHFKCTNGGNIDELLCKDESSSALVWRTTRYSTSYKCISWECLCSVGARVVEDASRSHDWLLTYLLTFWNTTPRPSLAVTVLIPVDAEKRKYPKEIFGGNGWMMMMIHEQKFRSISRCGILWKSGGGGVDPGLDGDSGGFCVKWSVTLGKFDSFFYSNKCLNFPHMDFAEWLWWWMRNFYSTSVWLTTELSVICLTVCWSLFVVCSSCAHSLLNYVECHLPQKCLLK